MVVKTHCMHIYGIYNKLQFLKECIEDAEASGARRLTIFKYALELP